MPQLQSLHALEPMGHNWRVLAQLKDPALHSGDPAHGNQDPVQPLKKKKAPTVCQELHKEFDGHHFIQSFPQPSVPMYGLENVDTVAG